MEDAHKKISTKNISAEELVNPNPNPAPHTKRSNNSFSFKKKHMTVGLVVVLIIASVVSFLALQPETTQNIEDAAAIVNGEIISKAELDKLYNAVPPEYKAQLNKVTLLNQLIEGKVLYQEAKKNGINAETSEATAALELLKQSQGLTDELFAQTLAKQQTTEEELIEEYRKQIVIQKFLNNTLLKNIVISDDEVQSFYYGNAELFEVGEQATVRHILLGSPDMTAEEQDEQAKDLLKELTEENFCDYVSDHSTDAASIPTCGEYVFTQIDPYVEEFKELSFSQNPGEMGTVQTQFGTHIIWTMKKSLPTTVLLSEVTEDIRTQLQTQQAELEYTQFYDELKLKSEIEVLLDTSA
jgi:peptidyl-prolyl cis-trans isomerase C